MKQLTFALILSLVFVLAACSSQEQQLAGASDNFGVRYASSDNGTFNGRSFAFDKPLTTNAIAVGQYSEFAIWSNCSGNVNVTGLVYQTSPDMVLWSGNNSIGPCKSNLTIVAPTEKGVQYVRFIIVANNGTNASKPPQGDAQLYLAVVGK